VPGEIVLVHQLVFQINWILGILYLYVIGGLDGIGHVTISVGILVIGQTISRFLLCSVDDHVRVCRHIHTAFHNRNMIGTTAFSGGSVAVWGAFLIHFIFCNCKLDLHVLQGKKSMKIPNGQSESVYQRRTDNTITNRNSTKGQATIYKT
jgi:hypothetical protein